MRYFEASLEQQSFAEIAASLVAVVTAAEPALRAISEARADESRGPGKWSRKQILGHLVDSAANNHQRFVRAQATPVLRLHGYEQAHWVASQRYDQIRWDEVVALWILYNRHLAHVIRHIPEEKRGVLCEIGDNAPVSLAYIACDYVGHIQHHLPQILDRK